MITICVAIKNRTSYLLSFVIPSILNFNYTKNIALSVCDWGSSDTIDLFESIRSVWSGGLVFSVANKKSISKDCVFSKPRCLNQAISQAVTDKIFLCDADMSLPINFVEIFNNNVNTDSMWFPVCFGLHKDSNIVVSNKTGHWVINAYGMVGMLKSHFKLLGEFDEKFVQWGLEDDDFYYRTQRSNLNINRIRCDGLFHHWHEQKTDWHIKGDYFNKAITKGSSY